MTAHHPEQHGPKQRTADDVVDAFFDRELGEGGADKFFAGLRADLPRCAEVAKVQRVLSMLREPIEAPDVTDRVLAELARKRRFLPERLRRLVTTGRLAAAGVALIGLLGIAVVDRVSPGALRLTAPAHPVGEIVSNTAAEARNNVAQLASAVGTVGVLMKAETPAGPSASRSVLLALNPGVSSVKVLPSSSTKRGDSLVVYRGAGPDTRFVLPEAVYIDRNAAIVLPLGHMSTSRMGARDWSGISKDNMFLLPAVEPERVSRAAVGGVAEGEQGPPAKNSK